MSSLTDGPTLRGRVRSRLLKGRIGAMTPEHLIAYRSETPPGAVGLRLFRAPARCKVVAVDVTYTTAGAGASKIFLRKHLAAHVAAPNAAASGANITELVTAGIAADATVNTAVHGTLNANNTKLAAGDKLMLVTPATVAGLLVEVWVVYS